jgi:RNA ligase (TIGR02306 family)
MKFASIESIMMVSKHPNADALDIVQVLGYKAITKRNEWKVGDLCVFIQPDTVLPDAPWAAMYKAKSNRVKAIKLRGSWSMGIVESIEKVFADIVLPQPVEGLEVGGFIGVTKFEPPAPADNSAKGLLPFGIPKTDQERYQNLKPEEIPYGELVDVTLKVDGQSLTAYCKRNEQGINLSTGICGRTLEFKDEANNNYTRAVEKHRIIDKLAEYCVAHSVSLALRGESYGKGIQAFKENPHASLENDLALFSVFDIDRKQYANKGSRFYFVDVCAELGLPTVTILEKDVVLTPELIAKYDSGIEKIDGKPFEGVVINHANGSFKVISKSYDSKK